MNEQTATVKPGDRVKMVNGKSVLYGEVEAVHPEEFDLGLVVVLDGTAIGNGFTESEWTITITVEEPEYEVGKFYLDADGRTFLWDGTWQLAALAGRGPFVNCPTYPMTRVDHYGQPVTP